MQPPPGCRVTACLLDDEDDYLGYCAAEVHAPAWLGFSSRLPGALHVSARRLLFDPADHAQPVHLFAITDISDVEYPSGSHGGGGAAGGPRSLTFSCRQHMLGPEGDRVGPLRRPARPQEAWCLRLPIAPSPSFEESLRAALVKRSAEPRLRRQEALLLQAGPRGGSGRSAAAAPDAAAFASFPASRVLPLRQQRGVLHISAGGVAFDPLFPFPSDSAGGSGAARLPAADIAHVFPRSVAFQDTGFDVYIKARTPLADPLVAGGDGRLALALRLDSPQEREHAAAYLRRSTAIPVYTASFAEVLTAWQQCRISNYQYLCFLNKAASRSLADLSQYPVFPWVLSDYSSAALDLSNPAAYRDLSRPVGALNPVRLRALKERQAALEAIDEGAGLRAGGQHLYPTHYSSAGAVSFYLVRSRPEYQLCLQRGRFDNAQRIFESLGACWGGVLSNPSDFKELTPEFFDVVAAVGLVGTCDFSLGTKDNGSEVSRGVLLPLWARGSASQFAAQHHEALESDCVSAALHKWIDLIFGCAQSGAEAARTDNTFHPYSYPPPPGTRDGGRDDLRTRYAREFGCTPTKLFASPHPPRTAAGGATIEVALTARDLCRAGDEESLVRAGGLTPERSVTDGSAAAPPPGLGYFQLSADFSLSQVATVPAMTAAAAAEVATASGCAGWSLSAPCVPPVLMVLTNLPAEGPGEAESEETLLTTVCDAGRMTVGVFDCATGERLRTFADFSSPVEHIAGFNGHALIFTAEQDLYLLRLRTRAVAEHYERFSYGVTVLSASSSSSGCLALADTEAQLRVWHVPSASAGDITDALHCAPGLTSLEAPARVTQLCVDGSDARGGPVVLFSTVEGELWWWRTAQGWRSFHLADDIHPAASTLVLTLASLRWVGKPSALVLRPFSLQLYSLADGAMLSHFTADQCGAGSFIGAVPLSNSLPLPRLCFGEGGRGVVVSHGGTADGGEIHVSPLDYSAAVSSDDGLSPFMCSEDGLVAVFSDIGSVAIHYCEQL